jgi:uncharacterized membrane protein
MGRGLDPDFHMAAEAQPLLRQVLRARYRPRPWRSAAGRAARLAGQAGSCRRTCRALLRNARRGHVQVGIEIAHLKRVGDQIDRAANRLAIALVIAALIIGSSIVMTVGGGPTLFGLPAFGLLGFVGAVAGGLWLLRSIRRVSQRLEAARARPRRLAHRLGHPHRQLAIFGFVLLVLEMLWGRASLVVFAVSFDGMPDFKGSLLALLDPRTSASSSPGSRWARVFAGLIFAVSVVSIPMILHRQTDAITAGLTSLRLVLTQTGVMLLVGPDHRCWWCWRCCPGSPACWWSGPVVGHASWHAYRAAVQYER